MEDIAHQPRLYLVAQASQEAAERLAIVLAGVEVAALLICAPDHGTTDERLAHEIVGLGQRHGAAVLIENEPNLAMRLGCDGVHLPWGADLAQRFEEARKVLGREAIIGGSAGKSRHDAMMLGEAGASYISFGIPPNVNDREGARKRRDDLACWCAEIFETPCVAFDVETSEDVARLAQCGVDFVGMSLPEAIRQDELCDHVRGLLSLADGAVAVRRVE